jgi:putative tricarboxylic transport membrane protein
VDLLVGLADALTLAVRPTMLMYLTAGVVLGLFIGCLPGLGGATGLAILLPFTMFMDTPSAIMLMMGMAASSNVSDTLPAVLFAIPGGSASQATVLDGYPMARQGQAGRALGAAYSASMLGGIVGALVLLAVIPIARPIVMTFASPELFMLGVLGLSTTAMLSGRAPMKGIVAACLGLLLGMVGLDALTGTPRWTFGTLYLYDGLSLILVGLGVFAFPELIELMVGGTRISKERVSPSQAGTLQGIRDTWRHRFLVLRTSVLGVFIGIIPGLGGAVVDWFAYAHAYQTEKGAKESFGKGDVRGVIGVDAATNSKEGGALIPTLLFGVPGSVTMALLIAMFLMHGVQPGPGMIDERLDLTLLIFVALMLANVLATGLMLGLSSFTAKVTMMPIHLLAPLVMVTLAFAAYQSKVQPGDVIALMGLGLLGWLMKRNGWPRPPLVLGFVLSGILERYLAISVRRYGFEWLTFPPVMAIGALVVVALVLGVRSARDQARQTAAGTGKR